MIRSFGGQGTEDIFYGEDTKAARKTCPTSIWPVGVRRLDALHVAEDLHDVAAIPGHRFEWLKGKWVGWASVRINSQYRIVFQWNNGAAEDVEIVDYHD